MPVIPSAPVIARGRSWVGLRRSPAVKVITLNPMYAKNVKATLATIFSVYLSNSAQALAVNDTGLQVEALTAGYGGGTVIEAVNFAVAPGEAVAVLGRNGVGKTTLLKCIMGLLARTSGSIRFDGADITTDAQFKFKGQSAATRKLLAALASGRKWSDRKPA